MTPQPDITQTLAYKRRKSASVLKARHRSPEAYAAYLAYQREYRERE